MLCVPLSRNQIIQIVHSLTKKKVDDLVALHAMAPYAESLPLLLEEKKAILVGIEKEYKITGVSFNDRQEIVKLLKVDEIIHFEHQQDNEFDSNAIAVNRNDGSQIGYLPKNLAEMVVDVIGSLDGKVIAILGDDEVQDENEKQKFLGVRFKFVRKSTSHEFIAVNLDAVEIMTEQINSASSEITARQEIDKIAKAQHAEHHKSTTKHPKEDNKETPQKPQDDELLF